MDITDYQRGLFPLLEEFFEREGESAAHDRRLWEIEIDADNNAHIIHEATLVIPSA